MTTCPFSVKEVSIFRNYFVLSETGYVNFVKFVHQLMYDTLGCCPPDTLPTVYVHSQAWVKVVSVYQSQFVDTAL